MGTNSGMRNGAYTGARRMEMGTGGREKWEIYWGRRTETEGRLGERFWWKGGGEQRHCDRPFTPRNVTFLERRGKVLSCGMFDCDSTSRERLAPGLLIEFFHKTLFKILSFTNNIICLHTSNAQNIHKDMSYTNNRIYFCDTVNLIIFQ